MNVEKHTTTTSIETISYRLSSKNGLKHYQFFPFIAGVKKNFLRGISKRNQIFFLKKKKNFYVPQKNSSFSCVWYMSFFDDFKKKNQNVNMWCVVTYLRYEMTNQRCHNLSQIYPPPKNVLLLHTINLKIFQNSKIIF